MRKFIAIDQYGQTVRYNATAPRAGLLAALNAKNASKIYRDGAQWTTHVGYKVGSRWFDVFELSTPAEFQALAG
jgi:hypothetical protein